MSSTITRGLTLVYGAFTVGGSAEAELHGPLQFEWTYGRATVAFTAVVFATTDALFVTACQAIEAAFRTPRQTLTISVGSSTWQTFSHSANSGFDGLPSISVDHSQANSTRCRFYRISLTFGLPADLTGENGLYWMETEVTVHPNDLKSVHAWGTYTALGANGAYEQCTDQVYTLVEAILAGYGGTWERENNVVRYGRTDKRATFDLLYNQIQYAQGPGGTDDPSVKLATLRLKARKPGTEVGSNLVDRPQGFELTYTAWVATAVDPDTFWLSSLRPWLYGKITTFTGCPLNIADEEEYEVERKTNQITVRIAGRAFAAGGGLLSYTYSVQIKRNWGWRIAPVWDGNPLSKDVQRGSQRLLRIRRQKFIGMNAGSMRNRIGRTQESHLAGEGLPGWYTGGTWFHGAADPGATPPSADGWYQIDADVIAVPLVFGQRDTPRNILGLEEIIIEEYAAVGGDKESGKKQRPDPKAVNEGGEPSGYMEPPLSVEAWYPPVRGSAPISDMEGWGNLPD